MQSVLILRLPRDIKVVNMSPENETRLSQQLCCQISCRLRQADEHHQDGVPAEPTWLPRTTGNVSARHTVEHGEFG